MHYGLFAVHSRPGQVCGLVQPPRVQSTIVWARPLPVHSSPGHWDVPWLGQGRGQGQGRVVAPVYSFY